ncbi:hypothetical protein [Salarchaeum sp. JOR-1]|uniref:VNG_1110C family protein n=1 Tax=Salarchaeum sp. JOR-1 TaxID=2599399 RepID=UPI001198B693|nr:hypothetical protein [Salarchaeum sp. JOR-1]QDX41270.1 hypothetical protein FQU85_10315 [Salarchaeum sp. JOR-1]
MPDPESLRDSTQIVLPADELREYRADIEDRFVVTVVDDDGVARIIGSPIEIKAVNDYLARQGISLP